MKRIFFIAVMWSVLSNTLFAQSHFLTQKEQIQTISLAYGLQPNMAYRATYSRQLSRALPMALYAGVEAGFIQPVSENFAFRLGSQILLLQKGKFLVTNDLSVTTGHLETKIYKANKWEINETLLAGWYGGRTGVALLAGFTQNLGTKLEHSDFYRETIYAGARDGWYGGLGGYWQAGFRVNRLMWKRFDLSFQMAFVQSTNGYAIGSLPASAQLGGAWRF